MSEENKGRAKELFTLLEEEHTVHQWISIFAKILAFLLNRYILKD